MCAGKLDPRWSGPWTVKQMKGPSSVVLTKENSKRTVHINRVRPLLTEDTDNCEIKADWTPPLFHHGVAINDSPPGHDLLPSSDYVLDAAEDCSHPLVLVHHR